MTSTRRRPSSTSDEADHDIAVRPTGRARPPRRRSSKRRGGDMRAFQLKEYVGPAGLELVELPAPEPADDAVLVDVRAIGVNFPDLLMTRGQYQFRPDLPTVPGCEVAGQVVRPGRGRRRRRGPGGHGTVRRCPRRRRPGPWLLGADPRADRWARGGRGARPARRLALRRGAAGARPRGPDPRHRLRGRTDPQVKVNRLLLRNVGVLGV